MIFLFFHACLQRTAWVSEDPQPGVKVNRDSENAYQVHGQHIAEDERVDGTWRPRAHRGFRD